MRGPTRVADDSLHGRIWGDCEDRGLRHLWKRAAVHPACTPAAFRLARTRGFYVCRRETCRRAKFGGDR